MTAPTLLSRIQEAKGADRELDLEIARALGLPRSVQEDDQIPGVFWNFSGGGNGYRWSPPAYTASLDCAMQTIPEGWTQGHLSWPGYDDGVLTAKARADLQHQISSGGGPKATGFGATPALALLAASLQARGR
jgi:hypothetical protein